MKTVYSLTNFSRLLADPKSSVFFAISFIYINLFSMFIQSSKFISSHAVFQLNCVISHKSMILFWIEELFEKSFNDFYLLELLI